LALLETNEQVRRHGEGALVGRLRLARHRKDFAGQTAVKRYVFLEQLIGAPNDGVAGRIVARLEGQGRDRHPLVAFRRREPHGTSASHALDEDLDRSVRQPSGLDDSPDHSDAEQVGRGGLLHIRAALGDQEYPAVGASRLVERRE
jgi:hypothetical protein